MENFGISDDHMDIWYILCIEIRYIFVLIRICIYSGFGIFSQEKSGSPGVKSNLLVRNFFVFAEPLDDVYSSN
jgi:hypothetical protein